MQSLNSSLSELDSAWQVLRQRWLSTTALWNDPVRWNFEREYWTSLEQQVADVKREMEQLSQILAQAQQRDGSSRSGHRMRCDYARF